MALSVPDGNDAKESIGVTAGGDKIEWIRKQTQLLRAEADVKMNEIINTRLKAEADEKQAQKEYQQWLELVRTTAQRVHYFKAQIAQCDSDIDRVQHKLQSDLKKIISYVYVYIFYENI